MQEENQNEELIEELLLEEMCHADYLADNYYEFFKEAWDVLEPQTPLVDNWHIKYLCDIVQKAVTDVALKKPKAFDLIINVPPRTAKSYIFSIVLPVWAWTKFPFLRFISASHSGTLSIEHCVKSRTLIESHWFQSRWGHLFQLQTDQNTKGNYENNQMGKRMAHSVGGGTIGWGSEIIIADDIMSPKKADSEIERQKANEYYNNTLYTRLNDQNTGLRIIVQQRLNEEDTTGSVLKLRPEKYKLISLPAEITTNVLPVPLDLKQYYKDNLFFPERYSRLILDDFKKSGSKFYNAQLLQSPTEAGGTIFKKSNWKFYRDIPRNMRIYYSSFDLPKKDGEEHSRFAGQIWGKFVDNYGVSKFFLIYHFADHLDFLRQVSKIIQVRRDFPNISKHIIEDKANGTAAINVLLKIEKWEEEDIIQENPTESKEARAMAVSYLQETGRCYLPHPDIDPTIVEYINELASFPNGVYNDEVDATSQALKHLNDDDDPIERLKNLLGRGGDNGK